MLIMGLGLRQSLIVTSTTGILLYAKELSVLQECLCCFLHVNYIVYKYLNTNVYSTRFL